MAWEKTREVSVFVSAPENCGIVILNCVLPVDLLRMFFDALYDEDVIKEEAFYKWESSKDPAEQIGKGVALKSVTAFFTWLREAEEEEEEEENWRTNLKTAAPPFGQARALQAAVESWGQYCQRGWLKSILSEDKSLFFFSFSLRDGPRKQSFLSTFPPLLPHYFPTCLSQQVSSTNKLENWLQDCLLMRCEVSHPHHYKSHNMNRHAAFFMVLDNSNA